MQFNPKRKMRYIQMREVDFNKPVVRTEAGVLAALWRDVLDKLKLIPALDILIKKYISDSDKKAMSIQSVKKKTKSTLVANITATGMTFKTFLDLLFNFLRVRRVHISIKLELYNGDESVHSVTIDSASVADELEDEEENIKEVSNVKQIDKPVDKRQPK